MLATAAVPILVAGGCIPRAETLVAPSPAAWVRPTGLTTPTASPTTLPATTSTPQPIGASEPTATAVARASPSPALTPTPSPPGKTTKMTVSTLSIPAYPYQRYLRDARDEAKNVVYKTLDWDAYNAAQPSPQTKSFTALVLENEYLRLTILPELGGRIYSLIFKPTGANQFYRNPVLKPTRWGPAQQGWWLAAGGMEWCLPVEEHGYESAMPWSYTLGGSPREVTVTVQDTAEGGRLRASVTISLPADRGYLQVTPRLENPTGQSLRFKFWLSAMLALGGANRVGEDTEFIFPSEQVVIHSSGDRSLPGERQLMWFPTFNGVDYSWYRNWGRSWLGFFAWPQAGQGYAGAYDHRSQQGMVRVFPAQLARGLKLFAGKGLDPKLWTDDGSSYFELHGGLAPTFWDEATLGPGEALSWTEYWYPIWQTGGFDYATPEAAVKLAMMSGKRVRVGAFVTAAEAATVVLSANNQEIARRQVALSPASPLAWEIALPAEAPDNGTYLLSLIGQNGKVLAQIAKSFRW